MSALERQVRAAQRRLWINRWLGLLGWSLFLAAIVWIAALCAVRLFALSWPLLRMAEFMLGAAMLGSLIVLWMRRDSRSAAAEAVDAAAGLRERVSSSLYCLSESDDFAQAVVADAQRALAGVSASRLISIRWSRSLNYGAAAVATAAALFVLMPPFDLLGRNAARAEESRRREKREQIVKTLTEPVAALREAAEKHSELKDSADLSELAEMLEHEKAEMPPDDLRIEAIKKLDRLADKFKEKLETDRYDALSEMQQMMSQLGDAPQPRTAVSQLVEAMQAGDYQAAQAAVRKSQEQLATRDHGGADPEQVKQLQEQLDEVGQKLQQLENQKALDKLKESGLSEKDVKRVLEALAKKDSKQLQDLAQQLAEQLKKQGMTAEKLQKLMQQVKKSQQASDQCKQLGQKMCKAGQRGKQGDSQGASQSLAQAGEMLSDMEMMAEELNELSTQMASMQDLKDELSEDGDWGKGRGRAYGKRERAEEGSVDFVRRKAKVHTGRGDVIGSQFIKGEQLKGEARAAFMTAAEAAQRDATDAVNQDRVPRSYHRAVKSYFDRLGHLDEAKPAAPAAGSEKPAK